MPSMLAAAMAPADWAVVAAYLLAVVGLGALFSRRSGGKDQFFLAGRQMPLLAVAISVLATTQSAASFLGGPQQSFAGDLTYLAANLGALVATLVTAFVFIPLYYHHKVTSVYELLGDEMGSASQRAASGMFMVGRVLASGARLFMAAIPLSVLAFGDLAPRSMIGSIAIAALVAIGYTLAGGIRAVIWTDVLQAVVYVGTLGVALAVLMGRIPMGAGELFQNLRATEPGKLELLDLSLDLQSEYGLWAVLLGLSLINLAAMATDQDITQRMLTCRSTRRGSWSVIVAHLISWPVVALFMLLGLLLHVFYARPDIMGEAAPAYAVADSKRVILDFLLNEMPAGLRGLMMAGLFAAAMSSLDSALNALASTTVADFYRPIAARRGADDAQSARREVIVSRFAVAGWGVAVALVACACVWWYGRDDDQRLIDFALGVMVFAYSGLLGVFLTAALTRRGNGISAIAALMAGFIATALLQRVDLANGWRMLAATALAFAVCCLGRRRALSVAR